MCRVKARITDGPIDSERTAVIATASGHSAEVVLPASQVGEDDIVAVEICRDADNILVQLPRETANGSWRVWVGQDQFMSA